MSDNVTVRKLFKIRGKQTLCRAIGLVVESLESRTLLSAAPTVSQTEVLFDVGQHHGLGALESYLNTSAGKSLGKLIDLNKSKQLFYTKAGATVQVALKSGSNVNEALSLLKKVPAAQWASPNYIYTGQHGEFSPNDPQLSGQSSTLNVIKAQGAWDVTTGNPNQIVAVLDDGLEYTHEDIQGNVFSNTAEIPGNGIDDDNNGYVDDTRGWDFVSNDNDVFPNFNTQYNFRDSHGTLVAGIIGSPLNNNVGVAGLSGGGVKILPIRFYGSDAAGTSASISQSIMYATKMGAHLMNISFSIDPFMFDPAFAVAYNDFYNKGGLWINSAGNGATANPPRLQIDQALFVSNTNDDDTLYSTSNWGDGIDLSAPGVNVLGLNTGNSYSAGTGTSFSAANTTGVAALIWSAHPTWTRDQVAAQLMGSADNIDVQNPTLIGQLGTGRINAQKAVGATIAAPRFRSITGLPAEAGTAVTTVSAFSISLKNVFNPSTVVGSSFELRGAGTDNIFGTADDVIVPITLKTSYFIGTNTLNFSVDQAMASGLYRFTAKTALTDPFGQAIDGNGDGTGGDAFVRNFTVGAIVDPPPAAPAIVSVNVPSYSNTELVINWTDNSSDETGFVIERSKSSTFATIDGTRTASPNTTFYYDWGLEVATQYYYRIHAVRGTTVGANSNTFAVVSGGTVATAVAAAPSNLVVTTPSYSNTEVEITWKDNSSTESHFLVERSSSPTFATIDQSITTPADSARVNDWGLQVGQIYYYRVSATNPVGQSGFSNIVTYSIPVAGSPSAPTGLTAVLQGTTGATVAWTDTSSNETGFELDYSTSSTFATGVTTIALAANTTTQAVSGLAAGATYYFRVRAVNAIAPSTYAASVSLAIPASPTAPIAPSALTAVLQGTAGALLGWTDNSNNETGFQIDYSTSGTFATGVTTLAALANATSLSVTGLAAGSTYYFRVRAVNTVGASANSASAPLIIPATGSTPFGGTAVAIPGIIQAENYDLGGEGVAYHDVDTTNSGGQYRTDGVDVEATSDTGGGYDVGYVQAGEWAKYTFTVATAGNYIFSPRVANVVATGTFHIEVDGVNVSGVMTVPNTGGFQTFTTISTASVALTAGTHVMRLAYDTNPTGWVGNINYVAVTAVAAPTAPTAPTGFAAALLGTTGARLTWTDTSTNETGFEVQTATDAAFTAGVVTTTAAANATTLDVTTGLNPSATYYFRVRAVNAVGPSAYSASATVAIPAVATAPTAPTSPTVVLQGITGALVGWTDTSSNETSFQIDYSTSSTFATGVTTVTALANATSQAITGLSAGSTYYFRVRAVNATGPSAYTATVSQAISAVSSTLLNTGFETPTTTTYIYNPTGGSWTFSPASGIQRNGSAWNATNAPEGVQTAFIQGTSALSRGSISQNINLAAGTYTLSFQAARRSGQIQPLKFFVDDVQVGSTLSAAANTFALLTTNTFTVTAGVHTLRLEATDSGSDKSVFVDAFALNAITAPNVPTGLAGTITATNAITLAWVDASNNETGFQIDYSTSSTFATGVTTITPLANATSQAITGLTNGQTYYFRIRAVNTAFNSAYSSTISIALAAPSAPTTLVGVQTGTNGATLTWVDTSNNETGFEVQGATNATFTTGLVTASLAANTTTTTAASGLVTGTTYYYRVRAINLAGNSAYSNTATVTPRAALGTPTGVTASKSSSGKIQLVWLDQASAETGYEIQRSNNSFFFGTTSLTTAANATSYLDTGLTAGLQYYYRIRAIASGSTGTWSTTVSATA